jgi:DNA-binding winged helix-turn-helix (wHTH) protein
MPTPAPPAERPSPGPAERFLFEGFVLDVGRGALLRDGVEIRLRAKSFDALSHLVRQAGRLVPKQELMDAVWPDTAVTDDSLVQCLMDIRRALGDAQRVIHTARGRGYRFDGEVRVDPPAAPVPLAAHVPSPAAAPLATAGAPNPGRWWLAATLAALALAAAAFVWGRPSPEPRDTAAAARLVEAADRERITLTRDGLVRAVGGYERAIILDPQFAPAHVGLSDASTLLGVFGAVRPVETYPRARRAALRAVEIDPMLATAHVALGHVRVQWDRDWRGAENSYRRALALDPSAPRAHVLYAILLASRGRVDEGIAQARAALALEPDAPSTNTTLAIVLYLGGRNEEAIAQGRVASGMEPVSSLLHFWMAMALADAGRFDEAMREALASRQGAGNLPTPIVGYIHGRAGRSAEALEVQRALEDARARSIYVPATDIALVAAGRDDRASALSWLEVAFEEHAHWLDGLPRFKAFQRLRDEPRFKALLAKLESPGPLRP